MQDTKHLSGLEFIQGIINGEIPSPPISHTFPMKMLKAEEGYVEFEVQADNRHLNPMGGIHGGFAATVLDSVTGCAVHTTLPVNVSYATVDLNVKMVRPVPVDTKLIAIGKVISKSKSLSTSEGQLKDVSGKIYAHGTATCIIKSGDL